MRARTPYMPEDFPNYGSKTYWGISKIKLDCTWPRLTYRTGSGDDGVTVCWAAADNWLHCDLFVDFSPSAPRTLQREGEVHGYRKGRVSTDSARWLARDALPHVRKLDRGRYPRFTFMRIYYFGSRGFHRNDLTLSST